MSTEQTPNPPELSKRIKLLIETLKKEEDRLRQKANFCNEHKFSLEEKWIRQKINTISEIRFEVELLESKNEFRPRFDF